MVSNALTSTEDVPVPMEELAMFKFDEELVLEEIRKPKAPKEVVHRRRVSYSRSTTNYAPQRGRASVCFLRTRERDTRMANEIHARG
jgi:hypothetical protein